MRYLLQKKFYQNRINHLKTTNVQRIKTLFVKHVCCLSETKCKMNELEEVSAMNCSFEGKTVVNPLKIDSVLNGTTCNISCLKDYQLKNANSVTCMETKWMPSETRCTKQGEKSGLEVKVQG